MTDTTRVLCFCLLLLPAAPAACADGVDFSRDVLPILASRCFACHGPDDATRAAELRLDTRAGLLGDHGDGSVVVAGDTAGSELFRRVITSDADERMPPVEAGKPLSPREQEVLREWIASGARWEVHWSFVAPQWRPAPDSQQPGRDPIDGFIRAQLPAVGLRPSPSADRRALHRRLTFDLTGLPPRVEDVERFVNTERPDAWSREVDRLLASPRYGEHLAVAWLDAARYADTHGYLFDTERSMWRWRDWVIDAFNANQPFDEFTVEQLAGDLLPEPTVAQQIATGFNRNHIINNEAGAFPQEYFVENIVDRVNTTATVWLGLTMQCAQCHDHKYDPISQQEFFRFYAFFNNVPEVGLDGLNTNAKPLMPAPTSADQRDLADLRRQLSATDSELDEVSEEIAEAQRQWETTARSTRADVTTGLVAHWPLDKSPVDVRAPDQPGMFEAASAEWTTGLDGSAVKLNGLAWLNAGDRFNFSAGDSFTITAWVRPAVVNGRMSVISRMENAEKLFRGYTLQLVNGFPAFFLIERFPDSLIQVQSATPLQVNTWQHLTVTYDGSGKAAGLQLLVDGVLQKPGPVIDTLAGPITTPAPFWIGNGHPGAKLKGSIDDVRVYDRVLTADQVRDLPGLSVQSLLAVAPGERSDDQAERVRRVFLTKHAPPPWRQLHEQKVRLAEQLEKRGELVPSVMVMQELAKPRETRMLVRGAWNSPGDVVTSGTPGVLPPFPAKAPRNRLGLAQWLVAPGHPLTARVAVNRIWQHFFGQGLVRTAEDFGIRGERPRHPHLLDALAVDFVEGGWDRKRLQRRILNSATYRQASAMTAAHRRIDPDNHWLARAPRFRMSAEVLRDQALSASGLLVEQLGGPSVRPYQPEGLWREVAFDFTGANLTAQIYKPDTGASLYRRSLYTFWKRTAPPPSMLLFDAPDRERCTVRRERTSTPLQALVLMNDPTFVEAARSLGQRMVLEPPADPASRIAFAFRVVTSRPVQQRELEVLRELYEKQRRRFMNDPTVVTELLTIGSSPRLKHVPAGELAACTVVASVLLNLDETVTRK